MNNHQSNRSVERGRLHRYPQREIRVKRRSRNTTSARPANSRPGIKEERMPQIGRIDPTKHRYESRSNSDWWAHIRSGFVRDPSGKHHKALRQAVWLYLYFLVTANWKTGTLFRKTDTIVSETGFSARSIGRWLGSLRKFGYVKTNSTGRALTITIAKWRPISSWKRTDQRSDDTS